MTEKTISKSTEEVSVYDVFRVDSKEGIFPINLTIGNPNIPPPKQYYTAMKEVIAELELQEWNGHGYIVEEDPFGLCSKIANDLTQRYGVQKKVQFSKEDIGISVGATGALDVIFKTILDPSGPLSHNFICNEVIVIAPYFVEYLNLISGNGGIPIVVHSNPHYGLDLKQIEQAINQNTRAIIINSPNNPTGVIYSQAELDSLNTILTKHNEKYNTGIIVIEDAVYDTLTFNTKQVPSLIGSYSYLFRVNSYSKSMSLSGERIGYFAICPWVASINKKSSSEIKFNLLGLRSALLLNMRMRVVHAPLLQHRVLAKLPANCASNIGYYQKNLKCLYDCLSKLNFIVQKPQGTFYLWAIIPEFYESEMEFRKVAHKGDEPLLYLPGSLFGGEKYKRCIRFAACVPHDVIEKACIRLLDIHANLAG